MKSKVIEEGSGTGATPLRMAEGQTQPARLTVSRCKRNGFGQRNTVS